MTSNQKNIVECNMLFYYTNNMISIKKLYRKIISNTLTGASYNSVVFYKVGTPIASARHASAVPWI